MTKLFTRGQPALLLLAGCLLFTSAANAVPAIWEAQLGATLTDTSLATPVPALDDQDDSSVNLSFGTLSFPFGGITYTGTDVLNISTNGFISLGGDNGSGCASGNCEGNSLALLNGTFPRIAPFWTDLDPEEEGGDVFINRFTDDDTDSDVDRIVITFVSGYDDCTDEECSVLTQVQLLEDGTIIFGYNGIDLVNLFDTADDDLLIGLSPGGGVADPGNTDYSDMLPIFTTGANSTVYELFFASSAPLFDLDDSNLIFTPNGPAEYFVSDSIIDPPASTEPPIWESRIGTTIDGQALDDTDDVTTDVALTFGTLSFPFPGKLTPYTGTDVLNISSNGFISLGGNNGPDCCDGDPARLVGDMFARIAPFWTDLDPGTQGGDIFINRFDEDADPDIDRIVITFATGHNECAADECHVLIQVQLLEDGTIIFGYNGIDLINALDSVDTDVLVGISPADGTTDPGSTNLSKKAPFSSNSEVTIYELFLAASAPPVDLDGGNIIFTPNSKGGFRVTAPGIKGGSFGGRGGGGGHCSLVGATAAFDPTLWILVLIACIYLGYRRPYKA